MVVSTTGSLAEPDHTRAGIYTAVLETPVMTLTSKNEGSGEKDHEPRDKIDKKLTI